MNGRISSKFKSKVLKLDSACAFARHINEPFADHFLNEFKVMLQDGQKEKHTVEKHGPKEGHEAKGVKWHPGIILEPPPACSSASCDTLPDVPGHDQAPSTPSAGPSAAAPATSPRTARRRRQVTFKEDIVEIIPGSQVTFKEDIVEIIPVMPEPPLKKAKTEQKSRPAPGSKHALRYVVVDSDSEEEPGVLTTEEFALLSECGMEGMVTEVPIAPCGGQRRIEMTDGLPVELGDELRRIVMADVSRTLDRIEQLMRDVEDLGWEEFGRGGHGDAPAELIWSGCGGSSGSSSTGV